jgi:Leucine-rich repeat (LRR) protein
MLSIDYHCSEKSIPMKKVLVAYPAVFAMLISCGGSSETAASNNEDKDSVIAAIEYAPLKTSQEVSQEPVYKHITDLDTVTDKATVIRFVSENYYQPFPTDILEAHNLQVLALTNMTDTELPAEISKFKNLTTLVLTNASITTLPESVSELQNLKAVSLSGCKSLDLAQAFDVLKKCPNIQYLNLSGMDLAEVPATIGDFTALQHLRISGNKFTKMPDSFYALQNIDEIHYSATGYDYDDFFNRAKAFPALKTISLQYCGFTSLPAVLNEYPALTTVRWREEWKDKNADQIIATTEKENKKFPKLHITWSEMSASFYDIY